MTAIGLALAFDAACATGHGTLDGAVFRSDDVTFRVGPQPESWRALDVEDARLAFRDTSRAGSVLVNARCNPADADTPLAALRAHLILGTTEREIRAEETIPFDRREALHTVMVAKLDGVPMAYDIYVTKKNGCVFDFVYVASPQHFESGRPAFTRFVEGFAMVERGDDS